jgi:hypothetical protein
MMSPAPVCMLATGQVGELLAQIDDSIFENDI